MDFEVLKAFQVIADCGSFSKAASKLYITQPALSKRIQKLEYEIGAPVFTRKTRGVELTDQGEKLLDLVDTMLAAFNDLKNKTDSTSTAPSGNIILGCPSVVVQNILPEFFPHFLENYPEITFNFKEAESPQIIAALQDETIDFGIAVGPVNKPGITYIPILKSGMICVSLKDKFLPKQNAISLAKIAACPFVAYDEIIKYQTIIDQVFEKKKLTPKTIMRAKSTNTIMGIVRMGVGIAIVPEFILDKCEFRDLLTCQRITDKVPQIEFGVIILKKNLSKNILQLLLTAVMDWTTHTSGHK